MVHRPSDARLLVNLISHEKDYSKQLATLLDHSQASLASFSAYASASAPPASQIIIQVAGALAGADEGLRKYAASLEIWQDQLRSLKNLEEEVGNVMRDREILVTRLIKVSKNQKPTRDTILASSSSSSLNFAKPEVPMGSKLAAAQSELQACEAHLAAKERELDVMRTVAVRTGLQARCKALVECGWSWGEMGKEGLRALESLDMPNGMNGHAPPQSQLPYNKPLPDSGQSDSSSLGPSQSASQERHTANEGSTSSAMPITQLYIPPAHSISDHALPNGTIHFPPTPEEAGGSSDDDDIDENKFEVRENDRFAQRKAVEKGKGKEKKAASSLGASAATSNRLPFSGSASTSQIVTKNKHRQRRSSSVFGSIAAFFHKTPHNASDTDIPALLVEPSSIKSGSRWKTRTDKNILRSSRRDSSDDETPTPYPRTLPADPISTGQIPNRSVSSSSKPVASQRLKKRTDKRNTVQVFPIKPEPEDRGWASDGAATIKPGRSNSTGSRGGKQKAKYESEQESAVSPPRRSSSKGRKTREIRELSESESPSTLTLPQKSKKSNGGLSAASPTEASISRNNSVSKQSITSAASAPVQMPASATTIHPASTTPSRSNSTASHSHNRAASLDAGSNPRAAKADALANSGRKKVLSNTGYPQRHSTANGDASLMSIVEGVAKQNREYMAQQDPNRMLFFAKAPPPASQILSLEPVPQSPPPKAAGPATQRPLIERKSSERSVPITPTLPTSATPVLHHPSPDLKPLRPALRNSSRSPSPIILASPITPPKSPSANDYLAIPVSHVKSSDNDDASSISSYETTREDLDDDAPTPVPSPPPSPPVPPKHEQQETQLNGGSDLSNSTTTSTSTNSTVGANPPRRRKSVRMSLPPTFSATPPAVEDADDADDASRRYEPWSPPKSNGGGWRSKIAERDMWQDSSEDENEDYKNARRLLFKFSRKSH